MKFKMIDDKTAKISGINNFDLRHTFTCGQCFRWNENSDGTFSGVAYSSAVKVSMSGNDVYIHNTTQEDVKNIWYNYFDFGRDYTAIKNLYRSDRYVSKAIDFGGGIHILNQEIFECLISFIISTQNQIPRIKKIVNELCLAYGNKLTLDGKTLYSFPSPSRLAGVTAEELGFLKVGYRAEYIVDAVNKVTSGEIDLKKIHTMEYGAAKKELMKIKGVGPKVADCVLLFSAGKTEAFPIDVWVQRTMRTLYMDEKSTNKQIEEKAAELFGKYAGFAQQYLFYYARENGGIDKCIY